MSNMIPNSCKTSCSSAAELLNTHCYCTTLDREKLDPRLLEDIPNLLATYPQMFSNTSVFISTANFMQMRNIIESVSRVTALAAYQEKIAAGSPAIASLDFGTQGVFMGFDFHVGSKGPQIIEINSNAGGAFLNMSLRNAQIECCREAGMAFTPENLDSTFVDMFLTEWQLQRKKTPLTTIAIVDENPSQQFLYPEFQLAQRLFEEKGLKTFILDPRELVFAEGKLYWQDNIIDLVYNRLTDFYFTQENSTALRQAYQANAVVVTPNPRHHALYADKRNLVILSNPDQLQALGANTQDIQTLCAGIPTTKMVLPENAHELWQQRRQWFFKPALGFGSRAAYRGDKLSKKAWNDITQHGAYIAQAIVLPSERNVMVDAAETSLKVDIRAYVYKDEIQLLAARLYQGQTTNFRTLGGGFSPVNVI